MAGNQDNVWASGSRVLIKEEKSVICSLKQVWLGVAAYPIHVSYFLFLSMIFC